MTTKKQQRKASPTKPVAGKNKYIDVGLRLSPEQYQLLTLAIKEATKKKGYVSKNSFCSQAVAAAAQKMVDEADKY